MILFCMEVKQIQLPSEFHSFITNGPSFFQPVFLSSQEPDNDNPACNATPKLELKLPRPSSGGYIGEDFHD